jgi:hypothetical protein
MVYGLRVLKNKLQLDPLCKCLQFGMFVALFILQEADKWTWLWESNATFSTKYVYIGSIQDQDGFGDGLDNLGNRGLPSNASLQCGFSFAREFGQPIGWQSVASLITKDVSSVILWRKMHNMFSSVVRSVTFCRT